MTLRKILSERKSVREFKEKKVPIDELRKILLNKDHRDDIVQNTELEVYLLEDGDWAYDVLNGMAGYNGHMVKAPHYALFMSNNIENHQIQTGYYAESLMVLLAEEEIDSCWLNIPQDGELVKTALGIEDPREAAALIAIGYKKWDKRVINPIDTGANYSKADLKQVDDNVTSRLKAEEIVFVEDWGKNPSWDDLKNMGLENVFYYVRMAPSTLNRQPWRFLLRNKKIYLTIRMDENLNHEYDLLEAGIMMFYMEQIMSAYSLQGKWTLLEESGKDFGIPEDYFVAGHFSM
ncbi:nitroreductase family protein [Alkalibacter mobilis]|uniref:nitroreductase family protein n=1 Tax=Alkalibacter mobilis TaxID=2787712 RepID=UPI00189FCF59|nr:nitroreductase family protein [Alkalibacter mobilis]MBF7097184.1 hypothetical protein [Alkalibacter mobilis]